MKFDNRRSFFKSLALLGAAAAAGCPGIFVPKFEPIRWKVAIPKQTLLFGTPPYPFNSRELCGKWSFISGEGWGGKLYAVTMPIDEENVSLAFHRRVP